MNCHGMLFLFQVVCGLHHQDVLECHDNQCGGGGNAGVTGDVLPSTPIIHSSTGMAGWGQILQLCCTQRLLHGLVPLMESKGLKESFNDLWKRKIRT